MPLCGRCMQKTRQSKLKFVFYKDKEGKNLGLYACPSCRTYLKNRDQIPLKIKTKKGE